MIKLAPIYFLFFMGFIGGGLIEYRILPVHLKIAHELCIYFLLLYALILRGKSNQPIQIHLFPFWLCIFFLALISVLINDYYNFKSISSFRFLFRYYFFYLALINLNLDEESLLRINKFILLLILLQLPVVAYKFTIYGVSERTIGIYGARGGGLTTMIPIVMVSYLMSYWYFYKRSIWLVIASIGFVAFGIVGAKAALFFLFPVTFVGLYYILVIKSKGFSLFREIKILSAISVLTVCTMAMFIYFQPRLNPDREVGGRIDFKYAFEFAEEYETGTHYLDEGIGTGRIATTKIAVKQLYQDGLKFIFFGYGPGVLTPTPFGKERSFDEKVYYITSSYGITGMISIWVEYGIIAVFFFSLIFASFFKMSWCLYKSEKSRYWKSFSAGSVVFCIFNLFIFLTYNKLPIADDTLLPVFYYAMAAVRTRSIREANLNESLTNSTNYKSLWR